MIFIVFLAMRSLNNRICSYASELNTWSSLMWYARACPFDDSSPLMYLLDINLFSALLYLHAWPNRHLWFLVWTFPDWCSSFLFRLLCFHFCCKHWRVPRAPNFFTTMLILEVCLLISNKFIRYGCVLFQFCTWMLYVIQDVSISVYVSTTITIDFECLI